MTYDALHSYSAPKKKSSMKAEKDPDYRAMRELEYRSSEPVALPPPQLATNTKHNKLNLPLLAFVVERIPTDD